MPHHFLAPRGCVEGLQLIEGVLRQCEPRPLDVMITRIPADGCLAAQSAAAAAVYYPFQHPHVLTEAGPQELAIRILAEPVHVEDLRSLGERPGHFQPVPEIIAHVIAAEG